MLAVRPLELGLFGNSLLGLSLVARAPSSFQPCKIEAFLFSLASLFTIEAADPSVIALLLSRPPPINLVNANLHALTSSGSAAACGDWLSSASAPYITDTSTCCSWMEILRVPIDEDTASFVAAVLPPSVLPPSRMRAATAEHMVLRCLTPLVRCAEAVVKLLPREHKPAMVAPIALATSAAETGQNRPE